MADEARQAWEKRVDHLVESINEASGTARTLFVGLLLVALTMGALVVGVDDEAMLRDTTFAFGPAEGIPISVSLMHIFAPIVFLFLHVNGLLQLDVLDRRLMALQEILREDEGAEHQRLRLHGFVFVQARTGEEDGVTHAILRFVSWLTITFVPLVILLALQIGFVRYQSASITLTHQLVICAEIAVLAWFHLRLRLRRPRRKKDWALYGNGTLAAAVLLVATLWAVPPTAVEGVGNIRVFISGTESWTGRARDIFRNPFDSWTCPRLRWGCRYLQLEKMNLLRDGDVTLSSEGLDAAEITTLKLQLGGLDLRNRSLRFAVLQESYVIGANLRGADLRGVNFQWAILIGANLFHANMAGAELHGAVLRQADLRRIDGRGIDLSDTRMDHAQFENARLDGAYLGHADLTGADFSFASLAGANLKGAILRNATLESANLTGVDLSGAELSGANFNHATLDIVDFRGAQLPPATRLCRRIARLTIHDLGPSSKVLPPPPTPEEYQEALSRELTRLACTDPLVGRNLFSRWIGLDDLPLELKGVEQVLDGDRSLCAPFKETTSADQP